MVGILKSCFIHSDLESSLLNPAHIMKYLLASLKLSSLSSLDHKSHNMTFCMSYLQKKYCLLYKSFLIVNQMENKEKLIIKEFLLFLSPNQSVLIEIHFHILNLSDRNLSNTAQKGQCLNLHSSL